jgi:hypothetical protein
VSELLHLRSIFDKRLARHRQPTGYSLCLQ